MRTPKATYRNRCGKPGNKPRTADIGEEKRVREMIPVQRVAMKLISDAATGSAASGLRTGMVDGLLVWARGERGARGDAACGQWL